jgi:hypothetical protein
LGIGEFAAGIEERCDGGIPHNSIARSRSSICHGRAEDALLQVFTPGAASGLRYPENQLVRLGI